MDRLNVYVTVAFLNFSERSRLTNKPVFAFGYAAVIRLILG